MNPDVLFQTIYILSFIFLVLNVASFIWSVMGVFEKSDDQTSTSYHLLKIISLSIFSLSIYLYWSHYTQHILTASISLMLQLSAFALFWYSAYTIRNTRFTLAFSDDEPNTLFKGGPYQWVRNPFYLAYLLCYSAVFIATLNGVFLLLLITMSVIYIKAIHKEEAKFINSPLQAEYNDYCLTTARLLPKLF